MPTPQTNPQNPPDLTTQDQAQPPEQETSQMHFNANGPTIIGAIEAANHEAFRAAIEDALNQALSDS